MNIFIYAQVEIAPSPNPTFPSRIWGHRTRTQVVSGRVRVGQICRVRNEATLKPNTEPFNSAKKSTPAERKLWSRIRDDQLGVTFRRHHAVGNYIPDFCSPKAKLIIEMDGSQHLEQEECDNERTKYLESLGYQVVRFWNNDVMKNIDGVILTIMNAMENETSKD